VTIYTKRYSEGGRTVIKTVKECDFCQEQIDWENMRKDATPNLWHKIVIIVKDDEGKTIDSTVIEVCEKHDLNCPSLSDVISTSLY
jgi:hypothetical protein